MSHKDPQARREYQRGYYHSAHRREPQRLAATTVRRRRRAFIDALKAGPCTDCGQVFPPECMDFDHLAEKRMGVGRMLQMGEAAIRLEVARCELVCANCHRIRTVARLRARLAK